MTHGSEELIHVHVNAIFLDFYGTLVHEDDRVVSMICNEVSERAWVKCDSQEVGRFWWREFSELVRGSYHESFRLQREIAKLSLEKTIEHFHADCSADRLVQKQFEYWMKPDLFDDTIGFLNSLEGYKVFILSNIDTADLIAAVTHHGIRVNGIYTSEDVKSYKPRKEMFQRCLDENNLAADQVIHIGDSYSSDIVGANNCGIKNIWLNRANKKKPDGPDPTFICKDLREVAMLLSDIEGTKRP